jgi:putative Holliday junction resolvase
LDPGRQRTGVALCEGNVAVATPLGVVSGGRRRQEQALAELARRHGIAGLVVGDPLLLSGASGEASRHARSLARSLHRLLRCPVWLWDERLSTRALERAGGGSRDDLVAVLILQSFLDARGWTRPPWLEAPRP